MAETRIDDARYRLTGAYDGPVNPLAGNQRQYVDLAYATWWVRRGTVRIEAAGQVIKASSGCWVFCEPFLMRHQQFSTDAHLVSVRFVVEWRGACHFLPVCPPRVVDRPDAPLLDAGLALVSAQDEHKAHQRPATHCRLIARLHDWLALWHERRAQVVSLRDPTSRDPLVNRLVAALAEHQGVGVMDYAKLCRTLGRSRSQIDRLYKRHLGLTPRQWCERRALAAAEQWLSGDAMSVKEVAYRLGFVDGSHFARWFSKQTGHSPVAFRRLRSI